MRAVPLLVQLEAMLGSCPQSRGLARDSTKRDSTKLDNTKRVNSSTSPVIKWDKPTLSHQATGAWQACPERTFPPTDKCPKPGSAARMCHTSRACTLMRRRSARRTTSASRVARRASFAVWALSSIRPSSPAITGTQLTVAVQESFTQRTKS